MGPPSKRVPPANPGTSPPRWGRFTGPSRNATAPNVGQLFFPQSQALGIDLGSYSPEVLRRIVYAGTQNTSFAAGRDGLLHLAGLKISTKQVERVTERIGQERVAKRAGEVQAFLELPVVEKFAAAVAHPPALAVVEMDGGRLQIREQTLQEPAAAADPGTIAGGAVAAGSAAVGAEAQTAVKTDPTRGDAASAMADPTEAETREGHWREDKIGLLMTMTSEEAKADPCPTIPETFVNPLRIIKLARELKKGRAAGGDAVADPPESEEAGASESPEYTPPAVRVKSMVATRQKAAFFGMMLAAAAWRGDSMGAAEAFVADGAETNWTIQKRWFSDFVAILDFIHALSYVFAAAMAGRGFAAGWEVYVRGSAGCGKARSPR